jgi:hypothetical protein
MNSNIHKNENDDVSQRFQFLKTQESSIYEEVIATEKRKEYTDSDDMTTTKLNLERTPIRRVNLISGPNSAFARLFPNKYRQQEEFVNKQRSKSSDNQHSNIDRITIQDTTSDDEDNDNYKEGIRKSRRVRFYIDKDDSSLKTRTKSEPYLDQIHYNNDINYDLDPEIIHHDNPDDVVYTQKVGVRYLKPPTPPPHGPILIREIQSSPPNAPPPLVVSTKP